MTCLAIMNRTVPIIGVGTFCALTVASKLVLALVFDRYGLVSTEARPISLSIWVGVGLLTTGVSLVTQSTDEQRQVSPPSKTSNACVVFCFSSSPVPSTLLRVSSPGVHPDVYMGD